MRFALNAPRFGKRVLFSLLNGGSLFVAGFEHKEGDVFRVTVGVKNRFGEPIWFHEWVGKIGEEMFDRKNVLSQHTGPAPVPRNGSAR